MAVQTGSHKAMMVLDVRSPDSMAGISLRAEEASQTNVEVTSSEANQDGPIDLSRSKDEDWSESRPTLSRLPQVPPLIPINRSLLKKRWLAQSQGERCQENPVPLSSTSNSNPSGHVPLPFLDKAKGGGSKKRRAHEMNGSLDDSDRLTSEMDSRQWDFRLDRAQSVPHIRSLPPLLRCKSLSESRIAPSYFEEPSVNENVLNRPVQWLLEQEQELQRHRLQQVQINMTNCQPSSSDVTDYGSVLPVGYYTQMLQCFQAQEMLRRFALQQGQEGQEYKPLELLATAASFAEKPLELIATAATATCTEEQSQIDENASSSENDLPISCNTGSDECEMRKRVARPLTGKHVRSGTGASPSTLLTLRKKIQARQQLRASSDSSK